MKSVDLEDYSLIENDRFLAELFLSDMSSKQNIVWGTDYYSSYGPGYEETDYMQYLMVAGKNIIRPRIYKTESEKRLRSRDMAEVFTPSWIVNCQNNLIDDAWVGKTGTFNTMVDKDWIPSDKTNLGDRWKEYVSSTRLEVCCGEAPYLTSRYDSVDGKMIPIESRVGLYDRKLRVVTEYCKTIEEWLHYAEIATQSIYGYDLQGDNVFLSRENLLLTFLDYFDDAFDKTPESDHVRNIAQILSWNIWQMDGEQYIVPFSCNRASIQPVGGLQMAQPCTACRTGKGKHTGKYCMIKDWQTGEMSQFSSLISVKKTNKAISSSNVGSKRWF